MNESRYLLFLSVRGRAGLRSRKSLYPRLDLPGTARNVRQIQRPMQRARSCQSPAHSRGIPRLRPDVAPVQTEPQIPPPPENAWEKRRKEAEARRGKDEQGPGYRGRYDVLKPESDARLRAMRL